VAPGQKGVYLMKKTGMIIVIMMACVMIVSNAIATEMPRQIFGEELHRWSSEPKDHRVNQEVFDDLIVFQLSKINFEQVTDIKFTAKNTKGLLINAEIELLSLDIKKYDQIQSIDELKKTESLITGFTPKEFSTELKRTFNGTEITSTNLYPWLDNYYGDSKYVVVRLRCYYIAGTASNSGLITSADSPPALLVK
jgi:hypothetical protein